MTKELRGFINRIRKAQDRIQSGKAGDRVAISLVMGTRRHISVSVYRHFPDSNAVEAHECIDIFPRTTGEEISRGLFRMSQVVGFDI